MLLSEILRIFSLPVKEEQAWAICYFAAKILSENVEKGGKVDQLCEYNTNIDQNGDLSIHIATDAHGLSEAELMESLGLMLVKALNYGLHPDHPLSISENLDSLLLHMTSTLAHDEGVVASVLSFEDVISACASRISNESCKSDSHYKSVCKSLHDEACELCTFLEIISNRNNEAENDLQRGDWARIWMSVMSELRHGVKLKHCDTTGSNPPEFELTPFEVLLSDIKSQRYRLNHIELPQTVRKSAESVILDFIKSRPALRAAPIQTAKKNHRPPTARELLLTAIRNNEFQLRPTTSMGSAMSHVSRNATPSSKSAHNQRRKVIKIDKSRITDSDPEDGNEISSSFCNSPVHTSYEPDTPPSVIVNPQIKKLRTIAMTRSRSLSPPPDVGSRMDRLSKQQTVYEQCSSPVESEPDIIQMEPPDAAVSQKSPLTFEELTRIRSVLTAAELEQLAVCPHVQSDVAAGRVCFACRKVRFNLINWAVRCRLCGWNVCQKCTLPAVFLPGLDRGVPVCCDCHELLDMINNPKSPASSLSPSESTIQTASVDSPTVRRLTNDQRCV